MAFDIDPEEFEQVRRGKSSTPVEDMRQCPECGSVKVHSKVTASGKGDDRTRDGDYYCNGCGAHFDRQEEWRQSGGD